jgi:hypothetical protein
MDHLSQNRARMSVLGTASTLALYGLVQLSDAQILQDRGLLAAITLLGTFCTALLLTCGPLSLRAASIGGAILAILVTILMQLCAMRFASMMDMTTAIWPFVASIVLTNIPLPFWIAHQRGQWRNYDVLFSEAWAIALRAGVASLFTGLVWLLIYLFDLLLSLVGVTVIAMLLEFNVVPYLITGGLFGLGLAVVQELSDVIGPHLILRLLRLLVPITLFVVVIFLLAVPLNGFSNLFNGWSVGLTMLSMVAVAATLITAVVDQRDDAASNSRFLQRAARVLAGLLVLVALLGAFAIFLRARQYGWTPDRIFAAMVAVLALGYGGQYALASLRSGDWMARIRQANVTMALATIVLAAISLTPILNAERISANSQLAQRDVLPDLAALNTWGFAGQEALATLTARSKEAGQEALAAHLAGFENGTPAINSLANLIPLLPVSPKTADATGFLATLDPYVIDEAVTACQSDMQTGGKGCVLVVADFLPDQSGDEASLFYLVGGDLRVTTLSQTLGLPTADWRILNGAFPSGAEAEAMIRALQTSAPVLEPAPLWQLPLGNGLAMVFLTTPVY